MVTGGGLCDPGRIKPTARPRGKLSTLASGLSQIISKHQLADRMRAPVIRPTKVNPFPDEAIMEGREWLASQLSTVPAPRMASPTSPPVDLTVADGQPFLLHLMHGLARAAEDPDANYSLDCIDGHPLGVDEIIPPTPSVFPPRGEPTLDPTTLPDLVQESPNYPSATRDADAIRKTYHEDQVLGMTIGPVTAAGAKLICASDELYTGPLSTKAEPTPTKPAKLRTLQDGNQPGTNDRIRRNIRDQPQCPSLCDARHAMALNMQSIRTRYASLKTDVKKAHRREKVAKKDWKYMVSPLGPDEYYIHKAGFYGIASAHLFWARKAALLVCLLWAFIDSDDALWIFIYVDDF